MMFDIGVWVTMPSVEEIKDIHFTPPRNMHDFIIMRAVLAGYGATVRYSYMMPHRDFYRAKLYISAPENQVWVVKKIIKKFGGKIEEKEILVTQCYRGVIATHEGIVGYPIGVCGDWLIGVDLPCRLVVAGEKNMCLALMKYLLSRYFLDVGKRLTSNITLMLKCLRILMNSLVSLFE